MQFIHCIHKALTPVCQRPNFWVHVGKSLQLNHKYLIFVYWCINLFYPAVKVKSFCQRFMQMWFWAMYSVLALLRIIICCVFSAGFVQSYHLWTKPQELAWNQNDIWNLGAIFFARAFSSVDGLLTKHDLDPIRRYLPASKRPKGNTRYSTFQVSMSSTPQVVCEAHCEFTS